MCFGNSEQKSDKIWKKVTTAIKIKIIHGSHKFVWHYFHCILSLASNQDKIYTKNNFTYAIPLPSIKIILSIIVNNEIVQGKIENEETEKRCVCQHDQVNIIPKKCVCYYFFPIRIKFIQKIILPMIKSPTNLWLPWYNFLILWQIFCLNIRANYNRILNLHELKKIITYTLFWNYINLRVPLTTNIVSLNPARSEVAVNTTLCDKVCQWLSTGRWFSPGTPVSFTNKTDPQR
jgi:hypothetical protein